MSDASAFPFDPATRVHRALHDADRAWPETNCYVDLWIGVLNALELDPHASLPFTIAADFEGDQFTFYKPPVADLQDLYGVDVQELAIHRPLVEHCVEQVRQRRLVLPEVDAYWLPDVAGTDYRQQHTKTTIAIAAIDPDARRLGYFHNAGYFRLDGDDFAGVFGLEAPADASRLPPYTEFAKLGRIRRLPAGALVARSRRLLRRHLANVPATNPVARFAERLGADYEQLLAGDLAGFHRWAFATLRQWGSCFELAARYVRWLSQHGEADLDVSVQQFAAVSANAKALQLKIARSVNARRRHDLSALVDAMREAWQVGVGHLIERYHPDTPGSTATCTVADGDTYGNDR